MDYPYIHIESYDINANLSSAIDVRVSKDETDVDEAALVAAVKQVLEASGLPASTATKFHLTQTNV
jgi:hypothetical protein